MKQQVLSYMRNHPGCTSTAAAAAVRNKQSDADWIVTRREIDELIQAGLVEERIYRGITTFYAKAV